MKINRKLVITTSGVALGFVVMKASPTYAAIGDS